MTVILTVEDEFLVSEFLGHVLTSAGYEVVAAANADDAIAILEKRDDIRIVITDINMPGSMDGLRLAADSERTMATDQDHRRDWGGQAQS